MSDTRNALEELLSHPGWHLFLEHVKTEWAPGACWRKAKEAHDDLGAALQRIDYTNQEVGKLMEWPKEEIARLLRQEQRPEPAMSRGGYTR